MKLPWDKKKKSLELENVLPPKKDIDKYIKMADKIKNTVGQPAEMEFKAPEDKSKGQGSNIHVLDEAGPMKSWNNRPTDLTKHLRYKIKSYPDGSKYVILEATTPKMVFKINSYEDLWILNQIHDVVKYSNLTVTVTIPNLIDAQADKRFGQNESSGLKTVCNFLNTMTNFNFKIFHPHNAEVVEALIDRVKIMDNSSYIYEVLTSLKESYEFDANLMEENLILMSSDAGGFKPLMKLVDVLEWDGETFSASKSRKYENGHSKLVQKIDRQDFGGKDILIIDDICVGGGTFKGLSKMLKERNCGNLYLAVSHMTVANLGEDPVTNYFEKVFTSNSKWDKYEYKTEDKNHGVLTTPSQPKNLEIINLF